MASATPAKVPYPHIELSSEGVPILSGTTMKVVELVSAQRAYGWSPEELYFQHPYLSLSQIHSALAYYWDHKEELDRDIERRDRLAEQIQSEMEPASASLVQEWKTRKAKP
jgi:uncharacterized protein (DUF433 family)